MAVSKRLRYEVLRRDSFACRYCGGKAPDVKLTVDHVIPSALGGADEASNLVTACDPCNNGKTSTSADSNIIASVKDDALRWATAVQEAAELARGDFESRQTYRATFREAWDSWRDGRGKPLPLDAGWAQSMDSFREAGLPDWELAEMVTAAMSATKVKPENAFRYVCGIGWTKVRALHQQARKLIDGPADAVYLSQESILAAWSEVFTPARDINEPPTEDQLFKVEYQISSWHSRGVGLEEIASAARVAGSRRMVDFSPYLGWDMELYDGAFGFALASYRLENSVYNEDSMTLGQVLAAMEVLRSAFEPISRAIHRLSELAADIDQRRILRETAMAVMQPVELSDELFPDDYPTKWAEYNKVEWPSAFWTRWQPPDARVQPELPPWCGQCDGEEPAMRWIDIAEGTPGYVRAGRARCPRCNPYAKT